MSAINDPGRNAAAVTLSDTADQGPVRALYVGTGGDLKVTLKGGAAVTFKNVASGTILPIRASIVWSTGSSATDVVALY